MASEDNHEVKARISSLESQISVATNNVSSAKSNMEAAIALYASLQSQLDALKKELKDVKKVEAEQRATAVANNNNVNVELEGGSGNNKRRKVSPPPSDDNSNNFAIVTVKKEEANNAYDDETDKEEEEEDGTNENNNTKNNATASATLADSNVSEDDDTNNNTPPSYQIIVEGCGRSGVDGIYTKIVGHVYKGAPVYCYGDYAIYRDSMSMGPNNWFIGYCKGGFSSINKCINYFGSPKKDKSMTPPTNSWVALMGASTSVPKCRLVATDNDANSESAQRAVGTSRSSGSSRDAAQEVVASKDVTSSRRSQRRRNKRSYKDRMDAADNGTLPVYGQKKWMDQLEDNMARGRISHCTRRLLDASPEEVEDLKVKGFNFVQNSYWQKAHSFVARAISAISLTPTSSWSTKEQELIQYMHVAHERQLNVNDVFTCESAMEWAASIGLLNVLAFLLDQGYPLQAMHPFNAEETLWGSAVLAATKTCQSEALDLILSKRTIEARVCVTQEKGGSTSFYNVVEHCDIESAKVLFKYGCADISDWCACWINDRKCKRNLETILKQIYPTITNVMCWSPKLHKTFPTTDRETLNWFWHALRKPSCSEMKLTDDIWLRVFSFLGRDGYASRRKSTYKKRVGSVDQRNIIPEE